MKTTTLLLSFFLMTTTFARAEDAREWSASLGAGFVFKKNLRKENTYENMDKKWIVKPIPLVQASYGRVSLGPQGLSFMALGSKMANVTLFIKRDGDRYHGAGMIPRKDSAFAGISAKFFSYGLNISHDIHGRSKGTVVQLNYGKMFLISEKFFLLTNFGLDWFDDKYAEYYYNVRSHEATATRREYHLNNYLQPSVGILPVYKLTEKSSLMGALNTKLVNKDVRNSPTMNGDKLEFGGLFGYNYNF
ncbi:hypothetical protein DOM21_07630 [Bacteriovorax stolpii]|uniref:Uncharacterized protein n=1 Tax=Bacteriovorax stolpii TaxID=960 RepID=A0A2K9NVA1_BACTC|nr:MipA/OmpV family protein [Bacteriovorax stolpii]AUN98694.1 hypothetical protein C0V70_11390 [Bacteriovorax stolpii]QDK41326.1 hypothetical protein DOM21_07630 [Bacteriovorax stolpii]TDP55797.1 outer membrane scaffolding protein for murein synthesis (MipA/OmpV family) [Bacteriovorax stolpii]